MPRRRRQWVAALAGLVVGFAGTLVATSAVLSAGGDDCRPGPSGFSIARQWNEATLAAIRRDLPAPTVHARNLFHVSVAMWDAWAAYDAGAQGYVLNESLTARDVESAREEAMSYAAYRVLESRYLDSEGASDSIPAFDALMASLCYPVEVTATEGDEPSALGNRIGAAVLAAFADDGSNEADGYADPDYAPVNQPLVVDEPGATMADPNRWQPLQIDGMIAQNGIPVVDDVQTFIGPHWGRVTGFALPAPGPQGLPIDPGPPPLFADPQTHADFARAAVEVVRFASLLDPADGVQIDASPGRLGATRLGTYDSAGHRANPATGRPYPPNLVNQADFARVVAEYWADGPDSETPPGHWNTIANTVSDALDPDLRLAGEGPPVDRLEWDVTLYFALNAATHDAAIAAWGAKGHYDYARPISMIRYLAGLGQSSDPEAPAHHPLGLPLEPGLVEIVTAETTAAGGRHEALSGSEGQIAVRSWTGRPADPETEVGGVDWILAAEWVPFQMPTFVTPSFAGYVSGHSTFSRAAAEVLTEITGSPFFPGGLLEWTVPAGSLEFEAGPSEDVVLQWATYADAADQAGLSRLYGGIHVRADDLQGRLIGHACGQSAWDTVQHYIGRST